MAYFYPLLHSPPKFRASPPVGKQRIFTSDDDCKASLIPDSFCDDFSQALVCIENSQIPSQVPDSQATYDTKVAVTPLHVSGLVALAQVAEEVAARLATTKKNKNRREADRALKAGQKGTGTMKWLPFMSSFVFVLGKMSGLIKTGEFDTVNLDGPPEKAGDAPENVTAGKRKRGAFADDEIVAFTNMTIAVKDVAQVIRDKKPTNMHPDLYNAVMDMLGFAEDDLMAALSHLVDHKAQGSSFVGMIEPHRVLWLRNYLGKYHSKVNGYSNNSFRGYETLEDAQQEYLTFLEEEFLQDQAIDEAVPLAQLPPEEVHALQGAAPMPAYDTKVAVTPLHVSDLVAQVAEEVAARLATTKKNKNRKEADRALKSRQKGTDTMKWLPFMSNFALEKMCGLIKTGVRTDKGFKEVHPTGVAKGLFDHCGVSVCSTQVYDHLRKWRQRWLTISRLHDLSWSQWCDDMMTHKYRGSQ
ncbi:hypothetical protein QYE76_044304 [Lolium multiflorum]|uniref:Uncharacterized protein n=1 Tax=Lolium multiflorum TaxID=4521 RepID=A0AAD8TKT8_LOLMU|nr:hypothetical protein QYE76_044304 [Lolium multiflorum]